VILRPENIEDFVQKDGFLSTFTDRNILGFSGGVDV
jgi:hypothetical protein